MAGAVVDSVFTAPKETVGIRLLRDMGWRPGQGIGPRLHKKAKARRKAAHARMFGEGKSEAAVKDDDSDEDEGEGGDGNTAAQSDWVALTYNLVVR